MNESHKIPSSSRNFYEEKKEKEHISTTKQNSTSYVAIFRCSFIFPPSKLVAFPLRFFISIYLLLPLSFPFSSSTSCVFCNLKLSTFLSVSPYSFVESFELLINSTVRIQSQRVLVVGVVCCVKYVNLEFNISSFFPSPEKLPSIQ